MTMRRPSLATVTRVLAVLMLGVVAVNVAVGDWWRAGSNIVTAVFLWSMVKLQDSAEARGRADGYRAARVELWGSFAEAVMVRGMHPGEWLFTEAERDVPPIAKFYERPAFGDE